MLTTFFCLDFAANDIRLALFNFDRNMSRNFSPVQPSIELFISNPTPESILDRLFWGFFEFESISFPEIDKA